MRVLSSIEYERRLNKAIGWAGRIIQFPFVRKVSLTGSMATGHATAQSDIDLFIQVEEGKLWWVRLAITIWIHLARQRRTRRVMTNKLCLNWFATFDGPVAQQRPNIVLAKRVPRYQNNLEFFLKPFCPILEFLARNIQEHRFINDPRTSLSGSQVRFSNSELGFHPPKIISSREPLPYHTLTS